MKWRTKRDTQDTPAKQEDRLTKTEDKLGI
jgi:hypothetical protein